LSLLLVLFCGFSMVAQQASGEETMRLIIDTDAMAEVDDQNALLNSRCRAPTAVAWSMMRLYSVRPAGVAMSIW
jgi:hypothetical protein